MGMYDHVRCDVPLPDSGKITNCLFQTKDFECLMDTYIRAADGSLQYMPYKAVPERVSFHGILSFYGHISEVWLAYRAKFTDDKLVGIELVEKRVRQKA